MVTNKKYGYFYNFTKETEIGWEHSNYRVSQLTMSETMLKKLSIKDFWLDKWHLYIAEIWTF